MYCIPPVFLFALHNGDQNNDVGILALSRSA